MTKCYHDSFAFSPLKRREVDVSFTGGDITSDAGVLLAREVDRRIGLSRQLGQKLTDRRCAGKIKHSLSDMLRQRILGLTIAYEDLNDHDTMRHDLALQTATGQLSELASSPTLCRLEQQADADACWAMHEVLIEQFIASHERPPDELVLDFDATNDPVHGEQVGRYFSGFYDEYCFLPLFVFCGSHLLTAYLRPAYRGAAFHAAPILKLLVERLRATWPEVRIIIRGDSGFAKPLLLSWCDRNGVDYVIGIAKNSVLLERSHTTRFLAKMEHKISGKKEVLFNEFYYAAKSWKDQDRRIVVKAEHGDQGSNPRFVITSLPDRPRILYQQRYCARGDMENRIKEQQFLFSDRTSCHNWWPNQFRLLLSGMAYTLLDAIRRIGLQGTELANAQVDTIRTKLLKVAAVIIRNTRRIKFMLPSQYPYQKMFAQAVVNINSS